MNNEEIRITPLGTVSPYCHNGKNCPSILVQYGKHRILLDCGTGISNYLTLPNDLENLTIIISHLHPDHYGELLSIAPMTYVMKRLGYLREKIEVYIPKGDKIKTTESFLDEDGWGSSKTVDKTLPDFDYLMYLSKIGNLKMIPYQQAQKLTFDDLTITFMRNPHPLITYSIKLETDKLKIVYSSDTGYEKSNLASFAKDANLFICESTFLRGQAKERDDHLYAYEAGLLAQKASVEKLLLTHFWPDADKQQYVEEAKEVFPNTEAAEEGKKLVLKR